MAQEGLAVLDSGAVIGGDDWRPGNQGLAGEGSGDLDIDGGVWICVLDGTDHDIKTNGCVPVLSLRSQSAEPTRFEFSADGRTA